jgi:GNAT superfamily N-acetyltransferase
MHSDPVAVDALETNLWSMFRILGAGPGGATTDTPDRLIVESPLRQPPYNSVLRFRDEGDRPLQLQVTEIWDRFRARGVTGTFVVHPTSPCGLRQVLTASGLVRAELLPGMIRDLDESLPSVPVIEGVETGEADEASDADWVQLVTWRYGLEPTHESYLRAVYANAIGSTHRLWLARIDGEAVSKVALHVSGKIAGIYGVATTEAGRGRGLASLLTLQALHAARDAGATVSVLHSTPMARRLYARLGYRDVAPFEIWAEPDQVHL